MLAETFDHPAIERGGYRLLQRKFSELVEQAPQIPRGDLLALLLTATVKKFLGEPSLSTTTDRSRPLKSRIIEEQGRFTSLFQSSLFKCRSTTEGLRIEQIYPEVEKLAAQVQLSDLCFLYEAIFSDAPQKLSGVFYTPTNVARAMVERLLDATRSVACQELRILDPACGAGLLLVEMARSLLKREELAMLPIAKRVDGIRSVLFGIDRDPIAVELTRLLLTLLPFEVYNITLRDLSIAQPLEDHFCCGNSLLWTDDFTHSEQMLASTVGAATWPSAFQKVASDGGFHAIIANPPYGLSRDEQIGRDENKKLQNVYAPYRTGKVNKYLLFMAKGYQLLRSGGSFCYVVPNAWLGIRSGRAIRDLLLSDGALREIIVFQQPIFSEPSVEAVIVSVCKHAQHRDFTIIRAESADAISSGATCSLAVSLCKEFSESRIPVVWSDVASDLYRTLCQSSVPIGTPGTGFRSMIALQAYARGKGTPPQTVTDVKNHVFHFDHAVDQSAIPYLKGSDVGRYALNWSGAFLRYGPWLAEPQVPERFHGPRILVREIIGTPPHLLLATYTDAAYLYNKSILHILPTEAADRAKMLALLAIVNSSIASFVIRYTGRKSQRRLFPKIVNDDLRELPVPIDFDSHVPMLSRITQELLDAYSENTDRTNISLLEERSDRAVSCAFGYTSGDFEKLRLSLVD